MERIELAFNGGTTLRESEQELEFWQELAVELGFKPEDVTMEFTRDKDDCRMYHTSAFYVTPELDEALTDPIG